MALNLSRNTKVFVSSVNGVGATGGVKTCHVSTAGTGYAVGDIVTLGTTSSNGTGFKCIVKTITGGMGTGKLVGTPKATTVYVSEHKIQDVGLSTVHTYQTEDTRIVFTLVNGKSRKSITIESKDSFTGEVTKIMYY